MADTPMFAPDGSIRMVPAEQVPHAQASGGKFAMQMRDPQGATRYVPHDMVPQALRAGGAMVQPTTEMPNAGLAQPSNNRLLFGPNGSPREQMQTSSAPSIVRGALSTLPAVGGMAGGILAAPAGGVSAVAGGALGAAGGESANLALRKALFDNPQQGVSETSPVSRQGLKNTAIAGALGAAAEVPGALMIGSGNKIMAGIAASRGTKQTGDVVGALQNASPLGAGPQSLPRALNSVAGADARALRSTLANSNAQVNIDAVVANARRAAQDAVLNSGGVLEDGILKGGLLKAVPKQLDIAIAAAKQRAGITGSTASPQQLFDFMQELRAFKGDPGKAAGVVQDLAKQIYRESGQQLRTAAPGSDEVLSRLTNYHAAIDALSNYGPGRLTSIAVSAATHPRTTAAISPFAAAAVPLALDRSQRTVGNLAAELTKR